MSIHPSLLNYTFQEPDSRDYSFTYHQDTSSLLLSSSGLTSSIGTPLENTYPSSFTVTDLSNIHILTQGSLGSCVANALALTVNIMKNSKLSRLYLYFNARAISGFPLERDTGISIRKGAASIARYGTCLESQWPYIVSKFSRLPSLSCYQDASMVSTFSYYFLNGDVINSSKAALTTTGNPIVFGIKIYESFLTSHVTATGVVPLPDVHTETLQGGHCMTIVGYDDNVHGGSFICANSWGVGWGDKGFAHIPYDYISNPKLCSDFCIIKMPVSITPVVANTNTNTNTNTNNQLMNKQTRKRAIKQAKKQAVIQANKQDILNKQAILYQINSYNASLLQKQSRGFGMKMGIHY
jgi:Papain family cysteine protease